MNSVASPASREPTIQETASAYNWCRPHGSLRTEKGNRLTPAMAAGIDRRPWTIEDVVGLLNPVS